MKQETTFISGGWSCEICEIASTATKQLVVVAPFITKEGVDLIRSSISSSFRRSGAITFYTNVSFQNIAAGSLDVDAVVAGCRMSRSSAIWHVPSLHAKAYAADFSQCAISSANLTAGGLYRNLEYGVKSTDAAINRALSKSIADAQQWGVQVPVHLLAELSPAISLARRVGEKEHPARNDFLESMITRLLHSHELLTKQLATGGKSLNSLFSRYIVKLLEAHGPLDTPSLHGRLQMIRPDLCDDAVDRIINGRVYGRKWKHSVRSAQQSLKRRGEIRLVGGQWELVTKDSV